MAKIKVLVYTYPLCGTRQEDGTLKWDPAPEVIDKLTLGLGWQMPLNCYNLRNNFYCGFEIKGDSDIFPVLEGKLELEIPSLSNPVFCLEMAVNPNKITPEHREAVTNLLKDYLEDDAFRAWWDDDRRGPDRKPRKNKQRILNKLETKHKKKKIPIYEGEDDLTPEVCIITPDEALKYMEFEVTILPSLEDFKAQLRKMQLKFHPDRNEGREDPFKRLQKCKAIVEELITSTASDG